MIKHDTLGYSQRNSRRGGSRSEGRIGKDLDCGLDSFFASFLCARPVALPISKPVARKNRLRLPNRRSMRPFTSLSGLYTLPRAMMNPTEAGILQSRRSLPSNRVTHSSPNLRTSVSRRIGLELNFRLRNLFAKEYV